ncbi:MAG: enolase [Thermoplasmata archaeon]|nr:enolase [Thermoplasmata archaeon]
MSRVVEVTLRAIVDSRGSPTVEAEVTDADGHRGRAGAPSGASTGTHEVLALPEGGVPAALDRFRTDVRPALLGRELSDAPGWDAALHRADGDDEFRRIGGGVATALSIAAAIARARAAGVPLWRSWLRPGLDGSGRPMIVGNCLNGGRHAIGGPEFQEYHAISSAPNPADAVRAAIAVHRRVGEALTEKFPKLALGRGDEGGWVAPLGSLEALELLSQACDAVRDETHLPVHPGLDLAASEFFSDGQYRYRDRNLDPDGQLAFLVELVDKFGLKYMEDPFEEEAFDSFAAFTKAVGGKLLVVGDDLYTTGLARLERGIAEKSTNSVLIKVNQVGTLTDTFATVDRARAAGWSTIASHRSGDLPEGWLSHFAIGTGARGLKCGLLGGERVAKLNELLRLAAPAQTSP